MFGEIVGIGEVAASGEENTTWMGLAPLTAFAPVAGVTETTCSGAATWADLPAIERLTVAAGATGDAWLPGDANATIITLATSTSAALLAVRAAPLRFN